MYYYINLDNRIDRKKEFENTWLAAIPEFKRHSAYKSAIPHVGCGISHVDAAESGFAAGHNVVAVFEDDAIPANGVSPEIIKELMKEAEEQYNSFDVIYLGASTEFRQETLDGNIVSSSFIWIAPTRNITATTGMIYSIRMRSRLQEYKRQQLTGNCVIPCDRFFSGKSWGPITWSPLTTWITKKYILSQRASYSDNNLCVVSPTTDLYPLPPLTNTFLQLSNPDTLSLKTNIFCVSAFFPISSKAPKEQYFTLAKRLLGKSSVPFVLFTTEECRSAFADMRPAGWPLYIYCLPVNSDGLPANIPTRDWLTNDEWKYQSLQSIALSRKNITVPLLQLWLSKAWFVEEAIERGHTADFIMWCDIGSHKLDYMGNDITWWPAVGPLYDLIKTSGKVDPIICFQRKKPTPILSLPNNCFLDSQNPGGHIISTPVGWLRHNAQMQKSLHDLRLNARDGFVWAYDETVLAHAIQQYPANYLTIPTWRTSIRGDKAWFPSFMFLSENWRLRLPNDSTAIDSKPHTFLKKFASKFNKKSDVAPVEKSLFISAGNNPSKTFIGKLQSRNRSIAFLSTHK